MKSKNLLERALIVLLFLGILILFSCKVDHNFKFERGKKIIYQVEYRDSLENLISSEIIEFIGTGEKTHFSDEQDKIFYNFFYSIDDSIKFVNNPRLYKENNYSNAWQKTLSQGIIHDQDRLWMHPLRTNQYIFTQDCPFPHVVFPLKQGNNWRGFGRYGTDFKSKVISNYTVEKQASYKGLVGDLGRCWYIYADSDFKGMENKLNMVYHEALGFILLEYLLYNGDRVSLEYVEEREIDESYYSLLEKRDEINR